MWAEGPARRIREGLDRFALFVQLTDVAKLRAGFVVDPAKRQTLCPADVGPRGVNATRASFVEEGEGALFAGTPFGE